MLLVGLAFCNSADAQSKLFWTDNSAGIQIHSIYRDGTGDAVLFDVNDLAYGSEAPWLQNISVDPVNDKIYWVEIYNASFGRIERSDFDGSNREVVVDIDNYLPGDVIVDPANQHVYWISASQGIRRQDYDGSNVVTLVAPEHCESRGLAAYFAGGKLFWIGPGGIMRSDLNGDNPHAVVSSPGVNPWDVAVDPVSRRVYWIALGSGSNQGSVRSARFDGSDVQIHLQALLIPQALTIDVDQRILYWTEFNAGLWRAELDGSDKQLIYDLEPALGIALDSGSIEPPLSASRPITLLAAVLCVTVAAAVELRRHSI